MVPLRIMRLYSTQGGGVGEDGSQEILTWTDVFLLLLHSSSLILRDSNPPIHTHTEKSTGEKRITFLFFSFPVAADTTAPDWQSETTSKEKERNVHTHRHKSVSNSNTQTEKERRRTKDLISCCNRWRMVHYIIKPVVSLSPVEPWQELKNKTVKNKCKSIKRTNDRFVRLQRKCWGKKMKF